MAVDSINSTSGNLLIPFNVENIGDADALYAGTAPVITNTQQAGSTIASAQKWAPAGVALVTTDKTGPFNYLGAGDFIIGTSAPDPSYVLPTSRYPNTYASGQSNYAVEFMYYGQIFELKYKYVSTSTQYRMYINDRKTTDLTVTIAIPPTAGSSNVLKFDLGSVAARKIRFEFSTMPFGGIFTGPIDSLWYSLPSSIRLMGFGDSYTDGSAQNTGAGQGTWLKRFGRLMNISDTWDQSRGGTGYITPGSFDTLPNRAQRDVVTYLPDYVIMAAGYNDATVDPVVLNQIDMACEATIETIQSGAPLCKLIIVGPFSPSATVGAARTATNATIKARAFLKDLPFIEPQTGLVYDSYERQIANFGPWITGTGRVGATTGSGNADIFIGTDAVHPTDAGHTYFAHMMAASFSALVN
jgi:lysophospholipase L1-like esterase